MGKAIQVLIPGARPGAKPVTVEFDTVEGLLEFLRQAGYPLPGDKARTAPLGRAGDPGEALYVALGEILNKPKGVTSAHLANVAELKGSRGLSGTARIWAQILQQLGFEMSDVVKRVRRGKVYYWLPGPRLQQAIKAMEEARLGGIL